MYECMTSATQHFLAATSRDISRRARSEEAVLEENRFHLHRHLQHVRWAVSWNIVAR